MTTVLIPSDPIEDRVADPIRVGPLLVAIPTAADIPDLAPAYTRLQESLDGWVRAEVERALGLGVRVETDPDSDAPLTDVLADIDEVLVTKVAAIDLGPEISNLARAMVDHRAACTDDGCACRDAVQAVIQQTVIIEELYTSGYFIEPVGVDGHQVDIRAAGDLSVDLGNAYDAIDSAMQAAIRAHISTTLGGADVRSTRGWLVGQEVTLTRGITLDQAAAALGLDPDDLIESTYGSEWNPAIAAQVADLARAMIAHHGACTDDGCACHDTVRADPPPHRTTQPRATQPTTPAKPRGHGPHTAGPPSSAR